MSAHTISRYPVETLWVDTVGARAVPIDWRDAYGGDGDGWTSYEAPECPTCGDYCTHGTSDDSDREAWRCSNEGCEDYGAEVDPWDTDLSGPMMNYHYPLPDECDRLRGGIALEYAASLIADLPLCLVEFGDGSLSLALTGGGMDLSWEICEAFTRLGYLPPLHFCDLPPMAGYPRDEAHRYTIAACLRSCEVAEAQARYARERLTERYGDA